MRLAPFALTCLLVVGESFAQTAPAPAADPVAELASAEADLAALRIGAALSRIEALLARSDLGEEVRVEALTSRAKAHAADNKLAATEEDYRQILALRPGWEPPPELAAPKLLQRFEKVRSATVGTVQARISPRDAAILVDGKAVTVGADGTFRVLAGEHRFRIELKGFDPAEATGTVAGGGAFDLAAELVPNARAVRIVTDVAGVEVRLGDKVLGVTSKAEHDDGPLAASEEAQLLVDEMPLGPRTLLLAKPCFRARSFPVSVSADLLDRTPVRVEVPPMEPSRGTLRLRGGSAGNRVLVDGAEAGTLPTDPLAVCAGRRRIAVVAGGREVFGAEVDVAEDAETALAIAATPAIALLGAETWPKELAALAEMAIRPRAFPLPRGSDLSTAERWDSVGLPADVDLAAVVVPSADPTAPPKVLLYSPLLRTVERLPGPVAPGGRPAWRVPWFGARLADDGRGVRIVEVIPGGPAAAAGIVAGDALVAIAGRPATSAREAREELAAAPLDTPTVFTVASAGGESRQVACTPVASPRLEPGRPQPGGDAVLAAFATVDAVASGGDASTALANLALAFGRAGRHDRAAETWRLVAWPARPGIGPGTAAYYLGIELERLGREAEAREAFRKARATSATAPDDAGPEVAPAAADHLADLGVGPS